MDLCIVRCCYRGGGGWCAIPGKIIFGLNIFYFKRKGIANKHKAYGWFSRKVMFNHDAMYS